MHLPARARKLLLTGPTLRTQTITRRLVLCGDGKCLPRCRSSLRGDVGADALRAAIYLGQVVRTLRHELLVVGAGATAARRST